MSSPEQTQPVVTEAAATGVPDDANDLRGHHFKRLMRKPVTLIALGTLALIVLIAGAIAIGPALGLIAAGAVLLLGPIVVLVIADNKAANDFFEVYAEQRGMTLVHGRGRLPQATPLLRKGDDRYTERTLTGRLAEGVHGTLALYTYEEETRDSDGDKQTSYYRYTVGFTQVAECAEHVPELYCQRKFGLRALEKFAFELVDGNLCCYVGGHKENSAELDAIATATGAVAKRLRDEALE